MNRYFTVNKIYTSELIVKDSRFFGILIPTKSKEEFQNYLDKLWKEHLKARHICYAYILDEINYHYYDDGEPGGTAGIRIYTAMKIKKLSRCALYVIRYFGGTKLGTGPLAKAYFDISMRVIKEAKIIEKFESKTFYLELDFPVYQKVKNILNEFAIDSIKISYSEKVLCEVNVRIDKIDELVKLLNNSGVIVKD